MQVPPIDMEFFDIQQADDTTRRATMERFEREAGQFLIGLGAEADGAIEVAGALCRKMIGKSRHYHSPVHVLVMLETADQLRMSLKPEEKLAVWFHDAIYDSTAGEPSANEKASARWMIAELTALKLDDMLLHTAGQIIEATARHTESKVPTESHQVMDLDLIGLASTPEQFALQSAAVRAEFGSFSDEEYAQGRIAFFRKLLSRPPLYRTAICAPYEPVARKQLVAEIQRFESQL